jgi:hypothetical protein
VTALGEQGADFDHLRDFFNVDIASHLSSPLAAFWPWKESALIQRGRQAHERVFGQKTLPLKTFLPEAKLF